ncbi:MAG: hypothetical protein V7637_3392 [Mycobacteriales bacterium]
MGAVSVADRLLVPFAGGGSGTGALSWGQQEMWGAIQRMGSSLALGGVSPLPAGMTVEMSAAVLSFILGRHPSLRTRVRIGPGGRAEQVVAAAGEAPLEIVETGDADPAGAAEAIEARYHDEEFDYTDEWPVRMAVLRHRGALTHTVAMYCHLALDGEGLAALIADLSTMDFRTGRSDRPVTGLPPLEQARWQASPPGQRRSEVSLRHWERLLRGIPPGRFGTAPAPGGPRYAEVEYRSPATDRAVRLIAARTGLDTSPVLLAAFAVALARVSGQNPSVAQVVVSNRFRPGLAGSISTVSHPGLCVVDVAGVSFDEAVGRARLASLSASKNAYYDPLRKIELLDRVGRERGAEMDIACFYNDRRAPARREVTGPPPTRAEVEAALPDSTVGWRDVPVDPASERFFLHLNDVDGAVDIRLSADTRYLPATGVEACAREMEAIAVRAALDPAARTGI